MLTLSEQPELALVSEDQDVITAAKPKSGSDIIDVESSDSSLSTAGNYIFFSSLLNPSSYVYAFRTTRTRTGVRGPRCNH